LGSKSSLPWTEWQIQYISKNASNIQFLISIDALTGEILSTYTTEVNSERKSLKYSLFQNYHNPFNSSTTISYNLSIPSFVNIDIFNYAGKKVKTLVNENQTTGYKSAVWDGKNNLGEFVPNGVYLYYLLAQDFTDSKKCC